MEVINPDWNIHVARVRQFLDGLADDSGLAAVMKLTMREVKHLHMNMSSLQCTMCIDTCLTQ